jgi:predicted transcriptional regulator
VKKEWTQKELARRADTTQARISELESLRGDPQMWTVEQVARVLGLELQLVPVDP